MQNSYYQIKMNKIFFSDRRTDDVRTVVMEAFKMADAIDGSYKPPTLAETFDEKYVEGVRLIDNLHIKIDDCLHKAIAAGYCLNQIKKEMAWQPTVDEIKNYSEMIVNKICKEAELKNEVLIYEAEAFLFQVRSNLDILIQTLKHVYPYLDENRGFDSEFFKIDGKKTTVDRMKEAGDTEMAEYFEKQIHDWIRELNKMRNTITHRSGLVGFTSLVFDSKTEKLIDPTMPNGVRADDYCQETFTKLLALCKHVIEKFILPKLS